MKTTDLMVKALLVIVAGVTTAYASDPTAVYARVDRVVLAPGPDSPDTIQIWGVFSMAKVDDRNDYLAPAGGYLYFKLSTAEATARKEWADFQQVAGTGQIVSFGSRYQLHARLRAPKERVENPDAYVVNVGLTKVRGNTEYSPIRALLNYRN
jgi:hypothetical protein